jgi:hypothetical protein
MRCFGGASTVGTPRQYPSPLHCLPSRTIRDSQQAAPNRLSYQFSQSDGLMSQQSKGYVEHPSYTRAYFDNEATSMISFNPPSSQLQPQKMPPLSDHKQKNINEITNKYL